MPRFITLASLEPVSGGMLSNHFLYTTPFNILNKGVIELNSAFELLEVMGNVISQ
jgi:hypothetical protein